MKILSNATLTDELFDIHDSCLKSELGGIIVCGSSTLNHDSQIRDVDYIVIIKKSNSEILQKLATIRENLSKEYNIQFSNTIGLKEDVENIKYNYKNMDGKLVQAIIELTPQNTRLHNVNISKLNEKEIKLFSVHNYYQLKLLLNKLLIRQTKNLRNDEKLKILKVARIALKMMHQSGIVTKHSTIIKQEIDESLQEVNDKSVNDIYTTASKTINLM